MAQGRRGSKAEGLDGTGAEWRKGTRAQRLNGLIFNALIFKKI